MTPQDRVNAAASSLDDLRALMMEAGERLRESNAPERAVKLCYESAKTCRSVAVEMRSVSRALNPKPRRLLAKTGIGLGHFACFVAGSVFDGAIGTVVENELEQRIYDASHQVEVSCEALLVASNEQEFENLKEAMRLAEQARQTLFVDGFSHGGPKPERPAYLQELDHQLKSLNEDVVQRISHVTDGQPNWWDIDTETQFRRLREIIEVLHLALYPESEEMGG